MTSLVGIGTDMIEISRIKQAALDFGDKFLQRVYTSGEIDYCYQKKNPWPSLAARFAAKEAVFKALGTGVTNWHEVEVQGGDGEPPRVKLQGTALHQMQARGQCKVLLSITHNRTMAMAFATVEKEGVDSL